MVDYKEVSMVQRFLKQLLQRALEETADSVLSDDFEEACKIADHVISVAEAIVAKTKTPVDDAIVAKVRALHELVCGIKDVLGKGVVVPDFSGTEE